MQKLFIHRCVFWRRMNSVSKYFNADETHVLWWVSYICFQLKAGQKYNLLPKRGEKCLLLTIFDGNSLYLSYKLCYHTKTPFHWHKYSPVHLKMQGSILWILFFKQLFDLFIRALL